MSEDQFTKLFKYMEKRFDEMDKRIDGLASQIDRLTNTIDGFMKRLDEIETEQLARDRQFEKLLVWARKV